MRTFQQMTKADVEEAQRAWVKCVTDQNVDALLDLYDFGTKEAPLLFKPTLTDIIRTDRKAAKSYFVGGDKNYPMDEGFLSQGWKSVRFQSAAGPLKTAAGNGFMDLGRYTFVDGNGAETKADYTFIYHKLEGTVLIALHHSSLTWLPKAT
mgnify:CR=1 FL=1